ncbi:MAG: formylglycine-generating enzyme family protein [Bacteroidales bacterium]|nr:formylglycine-generating enzyme family protein [Bacteroidales bacterium]
MKKSISTVISLTIMISLYSQTKSSETQPKGMVFIPQGAFEMNIIKNSETKLTHVTVDAFWMSNEITNREFKEFIDWAKNNPDKELTQLKPIIRAIMDPKTGNTKDTILVELIPIEVSSFSGDIIDPLALEKVNKDYKNYFTDSKYNDYPVVGVSFKIAEYYCLWKTMMENDQLKEKGFPKVHAYRIPLETEWEYVARQPLADKSKSGLTQTIQKVDDGKINDWGLYHFNDNVSEWITPGRGETGVYRGGSWKSEINIKERQSCNPNVRESYIGFRVVRSYRAEK